MTVVKFHDANGGVTILTNIGVFLQLVSDADPELWVGETGDCALERQIDALPSQFMFASLAPSFGYIISYELPDRQLITAGEGNCWNNVGYAVGGEPVTRPQRYFLKVDSARSVMRFFIDTGHPSPDVHWYCDNRLLDPEVPEWRA